MPNRFAPVNPGTPMEQVIAAMNRNFAALDNEAVAKTFNGPNGKAALIQGKLQHGFYGISYVDQSGNTVKLEGFDSDGNFVELIVKDGQDAYTVLGY